jgi:hypothetical protein
MDTTPRCAHGQANPVRNRLEAARGFRQIPDQIGILPDGPQATFRRLKAFQRWRPYTHESDEAIADQLGMKRGTWKAHLTMLRTTIVPGQNHPFVQIVWFEGRRRLYPVDKWGLSTVPPELAPFLRSVIKTLKSKNPDTELGPPTCRHSRASLSLRCGNNDQSEPLSVRQRSDEDTAVDSCLEPPTMDPPLDVLAPVDTSPVVAGREIAPEAPGTASGDAADLQAAAPSPNGLTGGQREFVAWLPTECRSEFDAKPAEEQARLLIPHERHFVRPVAEFQVRREFRALGGQSSAATLHTPVTFEQCVERLEAGDASQLPHFANDLERILGAPKKAAFWSCVHDAGYCVLHGLIPGAAVIDAAREAKARAKDNPHGYWWVTVQDRARVNGGSVRAFVKSGRPLHRSKVRRR